MTPLDGSEHAIDLACMSNLKGLDPE